MWSLTGLCIALLLEKDKTTGDPEETVSSKGAHKIQLKGVRSRVNEAEFGGTL